MSTQLPKQRTPAVLKILAFTVLASIPAIGNAREIEEIPSQKKEITVIQDCNKNYVCNYTYRKKGDGKIYPIATDVKGSDVEWVGEIAYITISFGSYDSTTLFVDREHDIFSVSDLISIDKNSGCFAYIDKNSLSFNHLFSKQPPLKSISNKDKAFNFMHVPTLLAVIEGEFTPQGDFSLGYTDLSGKEQKKLIKSPCKK